MTICDEAIVSQRSARTMTAAEKRDPVPLSDADLDCVAAAGSKAGGTTDGRGSLRVPGEAL